MSVSTLALMWAALFTVPAESEQVSGKNQSSAPSETTERLSSRGAKTELAELSRIRAQRARTNSFSTELVRQLQDLRRRYPTESAVREVLIQALIEFSDWNALVDLYKSDCENNPSATNRLNLGAALCNAQRFSEASVILLPLAEELPDDVSVVRLSAISLYFEGRHEQAAELYDRILPRLSGALRVESLVIRGLLYFAEESEGRALELFEEALTMDPDYALAHNAMGRVLVAIGESEKASVHFAREDALRAVHRQEETRRYRLSALSRALSDAWEMRRQDECERLIDEMYELSEGEFRAYLEEKRRELRTVPWAK